MSDLLSDLLKARKAPEIIKALDLAIVAKKNPGKADLKAYLKNRQSPTPEDLYTTWQHDCPADVLEEINQLGKPLCPEPPKSAWSSPYSEDVSFLDESHNLPVLGRLFLTMINNREANQELSLLLFFLGAEYLHVLWIKAGEDRGKHPLAPLVKAWQERPVTVEPDTKKNAIMPASFAIVWDLRSEQGKLFDISSTSQTGFHAAKSQGLLPTMDPEPPVILPSLPLILYDAAGGKSMTQGRGAPLALRLWVESILSIPLAARSGVRRVVCTLEELIAQLWPNGWSGPARDKPKLEYAFNQIQQAYIPWKGGRWLAVTVRNRPDYRNLKSPVVFDVELPPGSDRGPLVHRPTLRKYGVKSALAYRLTLGLAYLWNKYLTHQGKRLPPVIPEVKRDSEGYVLDAQGKIATGKSGQAATHWNDRRAIRTGRFVRNPEMERLPWLTSADLIDLGMPYQTGGQPQQRAARRMVLMRARRVVLEMVETGDLAIEEKNHLIRIAPPNWWGDPAGRK